MFDFRDFCPNKDRIYIADCLYYMIDKDTSRGKYNKERLDRTTDFIGYWNNMYKWGGADIHCHKDDAKLNWDDYIVYHEPEGNSSKMYLELLPTKFIYLLRVDILSLKDELKHIVV